MEVAVSSANCSSKYNSLLLEILTYSMIDKPGKVTEELAPSRLSETSAAIFIREPLLMHELDDVIRSFVSSFEPIVIWCAGARTKMFFDRTCIGNANIQMIIDSNKEMSGQKFYGHTVFTPDDIFKFDGKIMLLHATKPFDIENEIRGMGIRNDVLIL